MSLYTNLLDAGLPVISATEGGEISMGSMTHEQQVLCDDIILSYFQPAAYAELQVYRLDKQQFKNEYQDTITQLQSIEDAVNPTNAQVIAAIKLLAKVLRLLLKLLARIV